MSVRRGKDWLGSRRIRREELDGFVEGLYGEHESINLPESASEALNGLAEIRAMLEGARQLLIEETKPASPSPSLPQPTT